ncbi:outer membrane beta-barrel family protein [Elizabethkingia meningoseptica]|uniref:outer membrane beta-barrel family protein n=1 Tax=Elizabethkingia meningoseptica TaxID=238 RepID=UPI0022F14836|nr:outer membrane beta-barrel family protein [Elizabethkingia meningoseptica]EJK5328512.1 outer membrane beta-barrel protein [Elizabethkingia meningoseptica]MDE5468303.1 outer membrane beta-barrel family protein [Elizabethkingia meningoseptica]MDE5475644.1 outer membrane beta-barrel family protein [Elizabethkingia meningoseptica]MDE5479520.1 outer membrane beta-barrel family protein [Elizabethkingia meningoseptica]MDE5485503.1 outer membrane beta-barrel family protein [Elizabethkingia meningos
MKNKIILLGMLTFSIAAFAQETNTKEKSKEKEIQGVNLTKTKKAVEQKPDRTIFDFSEQPNLNSGSTLEGIKKLPGMVVTDIAGMMYQGKPLAVFMDGRPLNISSNDLTAFLEGMPANSIEKIEVITQPGAEFPATSGGAILNIVTSKSAKSYLTATYSGGYRFSNYDKFRSRVNNSIVLNSRNKIFGWQFSAGNTYRESFNSTQTDDIFSNFADRYQRSNFAKAAMTFELGKDRLLLNYDFNQYNNDSYIDASGKQIVNNITQPYQNTGKSKNETYRNEAVATYQKKFSDKDKKLDFKFTYTNYRTNFNQFSNFITPNTGIVYYPENKSDQNVYNFRVDYAQPLKIMDGGKFSIGGLYEKLNFETKSASVTNLDYQRQTASTYAEVMAKYKKFDFIIGARAEDYDISGTTLTRDDNNNLVNTDLTPFRKFKVFPNASIQYNFAQSVYLNLNYNKKISLPSISFLNPNNTNYQGPNVDFKGNPFLNPTIYDNFEAKISAFDYAFIGYNMGVVKNQVIQYVERDGDRISQTSVNVDRITQHNFNFGVPVPFMLFTKPLSEIMKFNFNPDKINLLYFYVGYQFQDIKDIKEQKGMWIFNVSGQFILPKDIKLSANFSYLTKGNYYYFMPLHPINNSLDLTLSKKFNKDRLTVSLYANDVLNGTRMSFRTTNQTPGVVLNNRYDSRSFGISLNYKIPTRNKLAKVDQNMLNQDVPKEDNGSIIKQ